MDKSLACRLMPMYGTSTRHSLRLLDLHKS